MPSTVKTSTDTPAQQPSEPDCDHEEALSYANYVRANSNLGRCYIALVERAQAAEARAERNERDAGRLDWLEKMMATVYSSHKVGGNHWVVVNEKASFRKGVLGKTLRAAIDAAIGRVE